MLRRAQGPERWAFMRFLQPLQDLSRNTDWGFLRLDGGNIESFLRIEQSVLRSQSPTAHRNIANAAPFAITDLKNCVDQFLRFFVSFESHCPRIRIRNAYFAGLQHL